jgi:hypothetical protein
MLTISNALWSAFATLGRLFVGWPQVLLFLISVVTSVLALLVWKYASNQKGITRAKDLIKANFYAMVLFGDSLGVLLSSILKTFGWIFVYLARQTVPLAIMMIPILPVLVQVDHLYSFSPVVVDATGQDPAAEVEVVAVLAENVNLFDTEATLTATGGVGAATKAVRIPFPQHPKSDWEQAPLIGEYLRERRLDEDPPPPEVHWRVKGLQAGEYELQVTVGDTTATKRIVVADEATKDDLAMVARKRHAGAFGDSFEYPGETVLTGPVQSIEVFYPRRARWWMWALIFMIETIIVAFALKGPFNVDF